MVEQIEIEEILNLIPHRFPFILVDKVLEYSPFKSLKAIKNVTINEPFFQGHFPGKPIMPGVLILEALALASAVLCSKSQVVAPGMELMFFFAGIDNARFKQVVRPGDVLELEIETLKHKRDIWKVHGKAMVNGVLACSADLISAAKEVKSDR
jgi:3-hydroxyacyl-[acyl-carrier-protein] dehydratase